MDHMVRGIRQMRRGLEAEVTLGVGTAPSTNITMKVVLTPLDPEWKALQQQLIDLFVRRATTHVAEVVTYNDEVSKRAAKRARAEARAERKVS